MSVQTSVQMDLAMIPVKLVRSTSCNSCCSVAGVTYGVTAVVDDVDRLEVSIVVDATATYESDDEAVFFGDVEVIFDFFFFEDFFCPCFDCLCQTLELNR